MARRISQAETKSTRIACASIAGLWGLGVIASSIWLAIGQTRPVRPAASSPRSGPVIVSGVLVGPPGKTAPTGAPAAGWILESSFQSPHGVPFPRNVQHIDADGLAIEDHGVRLSVSPQLLRRNDDLGRLDVSVEQFGFTGVGLNPKDWVEPPPSLKGVYQPPVRYWLTVFPYGQSVFVSGCRVGTALVPCGDDLDGIASELVPPASLLNGLLLKQKRRHDASVLLAGLRTTTAAVIVAALGWSLVLAMRLRRVRRAVHEHGTRA